MGAKFILGPIGFPYSITPGAEPDASILGVAGIGINIADHIIFSKDGSGNVFSVGKSYDAVLLTHFTSDNPHGTWMKTVLVDTDDIVINPKYNETTIRRIGPTNATITLVESMAIGDEVLIDNVFDISGTVTINCESAEAMIVLDTDVSANTHTLTGKGTVRLVRSGVGEFTMVSITR